MTAKMLLKLVEAVLRALLKNRRENGRFLKGKVLKKTKIST